MEPFPFPTSGWERKVLKLRFEMIFGGHKYIEAELPLLPLHKRSLGARILSSFVDFGEHTKKEFQHAYI
jgi:hypothetical protein